MIIQIADRTIRILILLDYPFQNQNTSGPSSVVEAMTQEFKQFPEHEFHIATLKKGISATQTKTSEPNVMIHYLKIPKLPVSLIQFSSKKKILSLIDCLHPHLIHIHAPYYYFPQILTLNLPVVLTVHGINPKEKKYLPMISLTFNRCIQARYFKAIRACHDIVAISPYVITELKNTTKGNFHLIPIVIQKEFFEVHRDEDPSRILFAGRLIRRKNIPGMLRVFISIKKEQPDAKFYLAGDFEDSRYRKQILDIVEKAGMTDDVIFLGKLSLPLLLEEYSRSTVFMLLSHEEVTPCVIAEAMAAGVPVLASDICGIPDMIENGKSGYLVNPEDHEQAAKLLLNLLQNKNLRKEFSKNAQTTAYRMWYPKENVHKTIRLYEQLVREQKQ